MKPQNIYARDKELEELRQFVNRRRSFLIHGSAGVGKTLLLSLLASETPAMLYCGDSSSTQVVFRTLAAGLLAKGNRHVIKSCGTSGLNLLKDKSAISLRGIVNEALKEKPYWIVLDHVQSASQSFASLVKDMCNSAQTPLIAAARFGTHGRCGVPLANVLQPHGKVWT